MTRILTWENGEKVVRDMTAEEITEWEQGLTSTVEQARETAKLTKAQFIVRCKRAGILSQEDALTAAKGDMPQTFLDAITAAGGDPVEAQIVWASVSEVWRMDTYIQILATLPGIGVAAADALFGIDT